MKSQVLFTAKEVENRLDLQLNEETLALLQANFPASTSITPVLALGDSQQGKSQALDSLLTRFPTNSLSPNSPFETTDRAEGCVCVYPYPIALGSKTLLLVECEGVNWSQRTRNPADLDDLGKKLAFLELELASVWMLFLEKGSLFPRLQALSALSQVQLTLIFTEEKALSRTKQQWEALLSFLVSRDDNRTPYQFIFRGIGQLSEEELTQTLSAIDASGPEKFKSIQEWVNELLMLRELAGNQESFEQFCIAVGRFRSSGSMEEVKAVRGLWLQAESIQPVNLFHTAGLKATLDLEIVQRLGETMDLASPAVVLLAMGKPGYGKSTFLNFIWQYLTGAGAVPFRVSSTTSHTTVGCQIGNVAARMPHSGRQVVLVDIEGVEGTEGIRVEEARKQSGLVNEAVKLASVVCILIENSLTHLELVIHLIHRISLRNRELGFSVERIILLFHDKNFSEAGQNEEIENKVRWVNWRYFGEREVVVVVNKPSLVQAGKREQVERFLQHFLTLADIPKRTASGADISLMNLFHSFAFTLTPSKVSRNVLSLAQEEDRALGAIAASLTVTAPHLSLTSLFCSSRLSLLSPLTPDQDLHSSLFPLLTKFSDSHLFSLLPIDSCYTALLEAHKCRDLNLYATCQLLEKNHLQLELSAKLDLLRSKYAPELLGFLDARGEGDGLSAVIWKPAVSLLTRKGLFDADRILNPDLQIKPVPGLLIVLISTADTSVLTLANQLVHTLVPLTPSKTDCFRPKEAIQGLVIPIPHASLNSHNLVRSQALLVVVTVPEREKDRERIGNIAWKLLEKAQVRVVMVGSRGTARSLLETVGVSVLDRAEEDAHSLAYRSQRMIVVLSREERERDWEVWTQSRCIPEIKDSGDSFETLYGLREAVRWANTQPYSQFYADLQMVVKEANGKW